MDKIADWFFRRLNGPMPEKSGADRLLFALVIASLFFLPNLLSAQILLDFSGENAQQRSPKSTAPGSGGGPTFFGGPSYPAENEEESDSKAGSTGGYSSFSSRFRPGRPGMTREDVVRQKQMEAWKRNAQLEEEMRRIMLEFRVKESLPGLFDEADRYLPKVKREETDEPKPGSDAASAEDDSVKPSEEKGESTRKRASETTPEEPPNSEERIDRELRERLEALDFLENPEERKRQKEILDQRIKSREQYRTRRAEAERGADFFQIPPALKLREQQLREGWCNLFDGKTSFGWRVQEEGPYAGGRFFIVGGEIRSDPTHPGLLYTTNQFGDSTVMLEYMADEDAEAFLLLRSPPNPRDLNSSCYAVVLNSADYRRPRGSILGRHRLSVEQLKELEKSKADLIVERANPDEKRWRKLTAQFDGTRLQIMIDRDEPVTFYDAKPLGYGYVGLLVAKGNVRFRNLFWQPGSSLPLFDGISPEKHWRYRKEAVQLSATRDITMQLSGGPGVIETRDSYDNFILQLEYNIAYTSARTGLFFRSRPREELTGYEVSIQNFPTRKDRDSVLGVDAGSFRNRKNARYIRPEDQKWNYLTLAVVDRQFQTWLNGIPVCEMSDRRPRTEGSEDGPFLAPGTIQLSAPEAGSSIQFRNIRITPIGPRSDRPRSFADREKTTWENLVNERRVRENDQKLDEKMVSGESR